MEGTKQNSFPNLTKRLFLTIAMTVFLTAAMLAQVMISGTIVDESGVGLPGVNVLETGTSNGTISDLDGSYSLKVTANSTVQFSFTGYKSQDVSIGNGGTYNINLAPDTEVLDEVVVTGYQIQRKRDISGAVAVIKTEDMENLVTSSFAQKLQGRAAGVMINTSGQAGDATNVRIRGISSFGNNDPLYVIDGVPVQDKGNLNINANDIETMQVLKDPSTASIYGSRASNGVIVITTKRGKTGKTKFSYSGNYSFVNPTKGWDDILITDSNEYLDMSKQFFDNAGAAYPSYIQNGALTKYIYPATNGEPGTYDRFSNPVMTTSSGTNWWEAITRAGHTQDHTLSVSGGNDMATFAISAGALNQESYIKYNDFKRYNVRANSTFKVSKKLRIGESLNIARRSLTNFVEQGEQGAASQVYKIAPIIPVYDNGTSVGLDGERNSFGGSKTASTGNSNNPLAVLYRGKDNVGNNTNILGNIFAEYDLIKGLTLRTVFNVDLNNSNSKQFSFRSPENQENQGAQNFREDWGTSNVWTWTNTAAYNTNFSEKHNAGILVGYESIKGNSRSIFGTLNDYSFIDPNVWYLEPAFGSSSTRQVGSSGSESALLSTFAKVDYSYDDKYFVSATIRRDGSSRFSQKSRFGTFPAVSVAWRLSNESFMKDGIFDDLKLKASWGKTGNQNIFDYNFVDRWGGTIGSAAYAIDGSNGTIAPGYYNTAIGTDALGLATKWESGVSKNIGIEATILNEKLNIVLDLYDRSTEDLLYNGALSATLAGTATVPFRNIASMNNKGFDIGLDYRNKISKDVSYNISLNGGRYKNQVTKVDGVTDFFYPNSQQGRIDNRIPTEININKIGYPISSFRGYEVAGIFETQADLDAIDMPGETLGGLRFRDLDGDKKITESDLTIIGSPHPDFFGGLNLGLTVKKISFNAMFVGSYGNDIFNYTKLFTHFRQFFANVDREYYLNNGTNGLPKLNQNDTGSRNSSTYFVEDGSYLRLGNLQIAYNLPGISSIGMSNLKVYVQGQNLFTITGYSGLDPALSNANIGPGFTVGGQFQRLNDLWTGYDIGQVPSSKLITLGLTADF